MPKSPTPALLLLLTRPHGKNVHRSNSPAICHASQPALAHINVHTHQRSENGYFTTTLCIVTLPKCLLCCEQGCVKVKRVNRSHRNGFYSIGLSALLDSSHLIVCAPQMKAHVAVSAAVIEQPPSPTSSPASDTVPN